MDRKKLIADMTVEEKVGQVCVPILQQGEVTVDIEKCIKEYGVGMLRFCPNAEYDGNSELVGEPNKYRTGKEMAEFLLSVQKMAKIPLFIAVDQEGSIRNDVNRAGAFAYSGHMSFGAADDTELTYKIARATGREFAAMGINLVQAPIVDVLTYSGRKTMKSASFGSDVNKVCDHALAMLNGFRDGGIAVMAKHFPGYGSVATDAHKGLAEITKPIENLECEDIKPMQVLFANGVNGVMTGHVLTHCIDSEYPATMSKKMIQGYLRDTLGFEGLVETDAMRMPAIQKLYSTGKASVMAIQAGCDLVLLRGDMQHFEEGYYAILNAVKNGEILLDVLDAAVNRILEQKEKAGLFDKPLADPQAAEKLVGCKEHKELAEELANRSVTCFKKTDLPLNTSTKTLVVCVEPQKLWAAQDEEQSVDMLYQAVKREFANADGVVVGLKPTKEEQAKVLKQAEEYDAVVIGTCNAILYEEQAKLVQNLLQTFCKTKVVVAMDSPYDYEVLGEIPNYICTYGVAAASARAVVEVLLGENPGKAKPPVNIEV